jgi:hypothetical protein
MHELDDVAFERLLRRTLSDHLGSMSLGLTADDVERRRVVRERARRRRRIVLGLGLAAAIILPSGWLAAGSLPPGPVQPPVVHVESPAPTHGPSTAPTEPATSATSRALPKLASLVFLDAPGSPTTNGAILSGRVTSSGFTVPLSFRIDPRAKDAELGSTSDFCAAVATEREITLHWTIYACISELRILAPSAVSCGTGDTHPTAQVLAAAMLAKPGLDARDLGPVSSSSSLPPGLLRGGNTGRVIDVPGTGRPFVHHSVDPDGCLIEAGRWPIEVRGDIAARFVLLDVDGQLVIVRAAPGGYDGPSESIARNRGYAGDPDRTVEVYGEMLGAIHDLSFGASAARP